MGYDDWLEAPYQAMYEETDRYIDFCESEDLDPEDPETELKYQAWQDQEQERYAEAFADRFDDIGLSGDFDPYWDQEEW